VPVGAGGGRQTQAAIRTPPVPTPAVLPRAATQATATAAGGGRAAVTPTAAEQAVPVLARRSRDRAVPQPSLGPGQPAADPSAAVASQPDHRCSRRVTTTAGRAATPPRREAGREVPHRGMDRPLAALLAKDQSAVTRRRPVSHRRCTRPASSRPGTPARTVAQGRDPSQARKTGVSRTAGSPAGHAVTAVSLTKRGSRRSRARLAHAITTVPAPSLAIQCWRSATRLQMSRRRRRGRPSLTAGRPGPGQLQPCPAPGLAGNQAARERHPGGTAPRRALRGQSQQARIQRAWPGSGPPPAQRHLTLSDATAQAAMVSARTASRALIPAPLLQTAALQTAVPPPPARMRQCEPKAARMRGPNRPAERARPAASEKRRGNAQRASSSPSPLPCCSLLSPLPHSLTPSCAPRLSRHRQQLPHP
jgi:hypothetical protein